MLVRTLVALAGVAVINSGLFAQQNNADLKVGDQLVIRMTGDLATEYARRTGLLQGNDAAAGLEIEATATIAQDFGDGRIRIEHLSHIKHDGNRDQLVTLTATVASASVTADVTPKGTPGYSSPATASDLTTRRLTQQDTKTLRLLLSELNGVKVRTWTLAEEIGGRRGGKLRRSSHELPWQPYSPVALAKARSEGKTVVVDFTAQWCLTCKWNLHNSINTPRVYDAIKANDVVPLLADWTDRNDEIKEKLAELKSNSIPVFAVYPAGEPEEAVIILRDLLTEDQVVQAIKKAGPSQKTIGNEDDRVCQSGESGER